MAGPMTIRTLFFALSIALAASPALAQTNTVEDEVISRGVKRGGDPAMDAFFRGDFETAEIEFEKNFRIIKRGRTAIEQAGLTAQTGILNEIGSQTVTAGSQSAGGEIQGGNDLSGFAPNSISGNRTSDDPNVVMSGRDPGFQLYMAGLSELQQGKVEEAEKSFRRAMVLNKRLYDGRMRLALIRLGQGDRKYAEKQLKTLERQAESCKGYCDREEELMEARNTLRDLLASTG